MTEKGSVTGNERASQYKVALTSLPPLVSEVTAQSHVIIFYDCINNFIFPFIGPLEGEMGK